MAALFLEMEAFILQYAETRACAILIQVVCEDGNDRPCLLRGLPCKACGTKRHEFHSLPLLASNYVLQLGR